MSRPGYLPSNPRIVTTLAVAALVVLLCAPAEAGRGRRHTRARTAASAQARPATAPAAPSAAGMVIAIDPETGRLGMPTPAQMLELSAAERTGLLRTSEGLTEVQLPDGSWMVDLQGRFHMYSVVRLDASGHRQFSCVEDEPALLRALRPGVPAAVPALEER